MNELPRISGRDCAKALTRAGFLFIRQTGSHMVLRRADPFAQVVVPDHRELDRGTLRAIIRQSHLTVEMFNTLLQQK
jgi:predicted RNA binding protein YcfA (HicA-like mRNA interferase family)